MGKRKAENRISRVSAVILALMLTLMAAFSFLYIGLESGHHCEEEECPVCSCIRICEGIIQRMGSGVSLHLLSALCVLLMLSIKAVTVSYNPVETLVSMKIRLND